MQRAWKEAWKSLFSTDTIFAFVLGSIFLGVLSNAVFQMWTNWLGTETPSLLLIGGASLVILLVAAAWLMWGINRAKQDIQGPVPVPPTPRRGLIYLIGRRDAFTEAFEAHKTKLTHVWLLCSKETGALADSIVKELEEKSPPITVRKLQVDNVHNPDSFFREVLAIYSFLPEGLAVDDVIADYTGMTAHASVGMVLACLKVGAPLEYTNADFDPDLRAIRARPPFEVVLKTSRSSAAPETRPGSNDSTQGGRPSQVIT